MLLFWLLYLQSQVLRHEDQLELMKMFNLLPMLIAKYTKNTIKTNFYFNINDNLKL